MVKIKKICFSGYFDKFFKKSMVLFARVNDVKKIKIVLLLIVMLIIYSPSSKIYSIEIYHPTKEELKGEISIPNREGEQDTYSEINTYEELYSVLEDLSYEYTKLLEEYNSMENSYHEEIHQNEQKIEDLEEELDLEEKLENKNNKLEETQIVEGVLIVIIIGLTIYITVKRKQITVK